MTPISLLRRALRYCATPRVALVLTLVLGLVVAVATLTPAEAMPPAPGSDKLHHLLAFGALAFPMVLARPRAALWAVLGVSAYGALIEVIQPHVGRHGDPWDALANAVGAVMGALCALALRRLMVHRPG